jgi:hypothetical protein
MFPCLYCRSGRPLFFDAHEGPRLFPAPLVAIADSRSAKISPTLASSRRPASLSAMRRLLVIGLAVAFVRAPLHADSPALTIHQQLIASPAPVGATTPAFNSAGPTLTLAWRETASAGQPRTAAAHWDSAQAQWSPPHLLTAANQSDAPSAPATSGAPRVNFPDGTSLSAFFPEEAGRIRDLHTQRHRANTGAASAPTLRALSSDSWSASSAPPEPAVLISREARVLAVWLNHAEKPPRLFAALSTSAGEQFFLPVRIDDGHPLGRASAVLLRDGSAYITWLESHGPEKSAAALWLRRLSPAGDLSIPVLIATAPSAAALGHPRLALLKDYDAPPAQLLIAHEFASDDGITQLVTRLVTLPPAESFAQGRPCLTCPPDAATLPGYPFRGVAKSFDSKTRLIEILHSGIPGILPAGSTTFRIDGEIVPSRGTSFAARAENRAGVWHLFDVQKLPDRQPR